MITMEQRLILAQVIRLLKAGVRLADLGEEMGKKKGSKGGRKGC